MNEDFTRRDFLRLGATTAAATAAVGGLPGPAEARTDRDRRGSNPPSPARSVPTVCGVCFWKCGLRGEIAEDGTLLHLRGNPGHPMSRGRLCPRGVGGIGMHQDPDRLRHPMIRTGERGQGLFRRASWEEAVEAVGRAFRELVDRDGPGALAFLTHGTSEGHYGHLAHAIGTLHHAHPAYDQCKGPREVGFKLTFGHELGSPEPLDLESSDCVLLVGSHLGENMHNLQVQELVDARTRGARLVVVDPRRSTAAEKADLWLPIRPGTDIALLLAIAHVLLRDRLYDEEFVRDHCDGFDELAAHVADATPSWAARETDLDAADIERAARMIGEAAPHVVVHPGRHVTWYGDDTQRSRAVAILVAITGSWGARGGYYLPRRLRLPSLHEAFPEMPPYPTPAERRDPSYPFGVGVNVDGIRQATRQGLIKAWLVSGTNLITTLPARAETLDAIARLEHLVVVDILPTEITRYADVLLPAASYLERPDPLVATQSRDPYVAVCRELAEPVGESRCECWMAKDIGEHLGLGAFFPWQSMEEVHHRVLDLFNERNEGRTIDWDDLWERGHAVLDEGGPIFRAGKGLGPGGTGRAGRPLELPELDGSPGRNRVRLYSVELEREWRRKLAAGQDPTGFEPLPTYYRPRSAPPGHVRLVYGRSPVHTFGRTQNTPVLAGRERDNDVWASPAVAEAFGLRHGEMIEVVNQDGARQGPVRLRVTARMRDDAVYMTHGFGHNSRQLTRAYRRGADDSALMTRYAVDPLSGGTGMRINFVRLVRPHAA